MSITTVFLFNQIFTVYKNPTENQTYNKCDFSVGFLLFTSCVCLRVSELAGREGGAGCRRDAACGALGLAAVNPH